MQEGYEEYAKLLQMYLWNSSDGFKQWHNGMYKCTCDAFGEGFGFGFKEFCFVDFFGSI